MRASMFKVVDSKSKSAVVQRKSFSEASRLAEFHNKQLNKVSEYKVMAQ